MALPALVVLLGLGTWQVQRLAWKTELIAFREAQLAAPPIPLSANLDLASETLPAIEHRRVTVTGEFLHDREIHLAASRRGRVGFAIITPLRRTGGPGSAEASSTVLVNRGWVPTAARDAPHRPQGQISGEVTVDGVVRLGGRRSWLTPENDVAENYWFWLDIPAMAEFAGVEVPPLVVEAGPAPNPGGLPIGKQARIEMRNDHLGYALTWYALAVALAVIYFLSQRRRPSERS
jgi:surfeit locus 1 family protein